MSSSGNKGARNGDGTNHTVGKLANRGHEQNVASTQPTLQQSLKVTPTAANESAGVAARERAKPQTQRDNFPAREWHSSPNAQRTNERTNEPTNERTNERTNEETNERTNEPTNEPTNQRTNERTNQRTNEPTNERTNVRTNERTNQRTNQRTNEPTNQRTNEPTKRTASQANITVPTSLNHPITQSLILLHSHAHIAILTFRLKSMFSCSLNHSK